MSLFIVVVNQSATIGFFTVIFGIFYGLSELVRGWSKTLKASIEILTLMLGGGIVVLIFPKILEVRFLTILTDLVNSVFSSSGKSFNAIKFSDNYGSVRSSAVQVGYESLFITQGFGLGLGGWGSYSVEFAHKTKAAEMS